MEPKQIIELLGGALASIDGDFQRRNRVERVKNAALPAIIAELSVLEREANDVDSVRLLALAKQVLTGKRASDEFMRLCDRVTGMV